MPTGDTPTGSGLNIDPASDPSSYNLNTAQSKDPISPHRLIVVLFIREYCNYKTSVMMIPKDKVAINLLILSLVQSPDVSLGRSCRLIQEKVNVRDLVTTWARGVLRLQEEGVAGLMDLVQSLDKLLTAENFPVSRTSVLGLLLRRVYLNFDKLSFSEVSSLRQQLDQYYRNGATSLARLLQQDQSEEGLMEDSGMNLEADDSGQAEYKLPSFLPAEFRTESGPRTVDGEGKEEERNVPGVSRRQADLFLAQQSSLLQSNESQALSPRDLQTEISRILESCRGLPEAHFLSYLNCLRVKELAGAVHSLYQFASCSQSQETADTSRALRYAALNLASYHCRLDHTEEAMSAIKEAITMAQESSDHVCLQHVLSLLYRVVASQDKQRLMERCITKSAELSLPYLSSLGLLCLAQHLTTTHQPRQAGLARVFDLVARSDSLNCKESITELQSVSSMVKSCLWLQLGRPCLAATLSQLLLQNQEECGESSALALVSLAVWLDNQGKPASADSVLAAAETLFPAARSEWSPRVREGRDRLAVRRSLARQDWLQARTVLERLSSLNIPDLPLLQAQLLLRQDRLRECRAKVSTLLGRPDLAAELRVRGLLLLSDAHNVTGRPALAVQELLTAVQLAEDNKLTLLYNIAVLHLANCHFLLGFPEKALKLTVSSLPSLLAHGGVEDCAKAWLLAGKAKIAASKNLKQSERKTWMLEGSTMLQKAKDCFRYYSCDSAGLCVRIDHYCCCSVVSVTCPE